MRFKAFYFWFALPIIVVVCWAVVFYGPVSARKKGYKSRILSFDFIEGREYGTVSDRPRSLRGRWP